MIALHSLNGPLRGAVTLAGTGVILCKMLVGLGQGEDASVISCSLEGYEALFEGYLALLERSLALTCCGLRFRWVCGGGVTLMCFVYSVVCFFCQDFPFGYRAGARQVHGTEMDAAAHEPSSVGSPGSPPGSP